MSRQIKLLGLILIMQLSVFAQADYTVNLSDIKATVQPTMWGLFFEDINRGAAAIEDLKIGDIKSFGQKMFDSDEGVMKDCGNWIGW